MTANNKLLLFSLFISVFILMYAPRGRAAEQILATITTSVGSDSYQLVVDYNDEDQSLTNFFIDNFTDGHLTKRDALSMNTFIKEGIAFNNKGTYNFARIVPENFDKDQGGMIVIDALYNIITGKRKSYEMQLAKDNNGWSLFNKGHSIKEIYAEANKLPLIGVVGAKDLIMK